MLQNFHGLSSVRRNHLLLLLLKYFLLAKIIGIIIPLLLLRSQRMLVSKLKFLAHMWIRLCNCLVMLSTEHDVDIIDDASNGLSMLAQGV
jgi:hypothetical protein